MQNQALGRVERLLRRYPVIARYLGWLTVLIALTKYDCQLRYYSNPQNIFWSISKLLLT